MITCQGNLQMQVQFKRLLLRQTWRPSNVFAFTPEGHTDLRKGPCYDHVTALRKRQPLAKAQSLIIHKVPMSLPYGAFRL